MNTARLCAVHLKPAWKAHASLPIHGWANHRSRFSWYQLLRVRWLQKHLGSCCLVIGWHAAVTLVLLIPATVSDTHIEASVTLPLLSTFGRDSGKMTYPRVRNSWASLVKLRNCLPLVCCHSEMSPLCVASKTLFRKRRLKENWSHSLWCLPDTKIILSVHLILVGQSPCHGIKYSKCAAALFLGLSFYRGPLSMLSSTDHQKLLPSSSSPKASWCCTPI